jgi:hypothetical protein
VTRAAEPRLPGDPGPGGSTAQVPVTRGIARLGVRPTHPVLSLPPGSAYPGPGASRESRITRGTSLVHADLHNHTLLSDGSGEPDAAFASMRAAGLDVAALTDHVHFPDEVRAGWSWDTHPDPAARPRYLGRPRGGLTPEAWELTGRLADAYDAPGEFTALRGFEWTEPWLGHVNVWCSDGFTPVRELARMTAFFHWLTSPEGDAGDGALAGFNHPGREPGRFAEFGYVAPAAPRLVSMEIFNRYDDYLFERYSEGMISPLIACLDAGWRPGLLGVSDEHEDMWGFDEGKGRAGLWVGEHSRAGVAEALRTRRFFATRLPGLRVDATANDARMGDVLPHRSGPVSFVVDLDRGPALRGTPVEIQVLRPGVQVPSVADVVPVTMGEVSRFVVPVDVADGDWVVLRVADPDTPNDAPGPQGHAANNAALAYTSPWYLDPDSPDAPTATAPGPT